jgi:hypothetical protein
VILEVSNQSLSSDVTVQHRVVFRHSLLALRDSVHVNHLHQIKQKKNKK